MTQTASHSSGGRRTPFLDTGRHLSPYLCKRYRLDEVRSFLRKQLTCSFRTRGMAKTSYADVCRLMLECPTIRSYEPRLFVIGGTVRDAVYCANVPHRTEAQRYAQFRRVAHDIDLTLVLAKDHNRHTTYPPESIRGFNPICRVSKFVTLREAGKSVTFSVFVLVTIATTPLNWPTLNTHTRYRSAKHPISITDHPTRTCWIARATRSCTKSRPTPCTTQPAVGCTTLHVGFGVVPCRYPTPSRGRFIVPTVTAIKPSLPSIGIRGYRRVCSGS